MQIVQNVLLPLIDLTVETRIGIVYTPVYTVTLDYLPRTVPVPANLVVVRTTTRRYLGFLCYKETRRLLAIDTFFEDHEFWSKVAEVGARIRQDHSWAAKFFYATLREIRKNKDVMITTSETLIE